MGNRNERPDRVIQSRARAFSSRQAMLMVGLVVSLLNGCAAGFADEAGAGSVDTLEEDGDHLVPAIDLPERGGTFEDWIPWQPHRGDPPEEGTLIYRTCDDGPCQTRLLRPDGAEFALADLHPELAADLDVNGLDGTALAHTGSRLGYPVDTGFEIVNLSGGSVVYAAEPGPAGTRWIVLEWSMGPFAPAATLAQVEGSRAIAFDASAPLGDGQYYVPDGIGAVVAPGSPLMDGDLNVYAAEHAGFLHPDETLIGPAGAPERIHHPGALHEPDASTRDWSVVKVFDSGTASLVAVVMWGFPQLSTQGRLDLPPSTADETWELLGLMKSGVVMAHRRTGSGVLDVVVVNRDGQRVIHTLPGDAEVLIPGAVRP